MLQKKRLPSVPIVALPAATAFLLLWGAVLAVAAPAPVVLDIVQIEKTNAHLAQIMASSGPSLRSTHPHVESGAVPICEDPRCGTSMTQDACVACSLYRQVITPEQQQDVNYHGFMVERGVALRATSSDPQVQTQLFVVALARNEILQRVYEGAEVALCEPCDVNARSFVDVQFGVERIPEGVILSYTSSRDDLVELLQVMLLNGHDLPL
jgi:hypothetical protein